MRYVFFTAIVSCGLGIKAQNFSKVGVKLAPPRSKEIIWINGNPNLAVVTGNTDTLKEKKAGKDNSSTEQNNANKIPPSTVPPNVTPPTSSKTDNVRIKEKETTTISDDKKTVKPK